jgi:hypothetical protein
MTEFEELLREIRDMGREFRGMSRIMLLANARIIEAELGKIATTTERKKMWVLMDGTRRPKDIAALVRVTPMAVSYFLTAAVCAKLVEYHPGEAPQRAVDYIPPSWIDLAKLPESDAPASVGEVQATIDTKTGPVASEVRQ